MFMQSATILKGRSIVCVHWVYKGMAFTVLVSDVNAKCYNTKGSLDCVCPLGLQGDGHYCNGK
jgi:hypothetical protein